MIKWSENLRTGFDEIDEEHRELIEKMQQLYALMRKGTGHDYLRELLAFLAVYVDKHFEHEEAIHLKYGYLERDRHKELHREFHYRVTKVIMKAKEDEVTDHALIKINLMMREWLLNHILVEDMDAVREIKARQNRDENS